MRVPSITSVENAIRIYYEHIELYNKDIVELFGKLSSATIVKLKSEAYNVMVRESIPSWNATAVNTRAAYLAWGLDINDLESRYEKLKQLS